MERELEGMAEWLAAAIGNHPIPRRVVLAEPQLAVSDDLSLVIWLCELISPRGALVLMGTGLGTLGAVSVWGSWQLGRRAIDTLASYWDRGRAIFQRGNARAGRTDASARRLGTGTEARPARLTDAELQEARLVALHPAEVQHEVLPPRRSADGRPRRRGHDRH